jgi:hypothetical protein
MGPLYISVVSFAFAVYMILVFMEMEKELQKNYELNDTIMARSRTRVGKQRNI